MEFVVEKAPFVAMAERVLKCVARNDAIPVMAMFKIEAADGRLSLTGTNLDMESRGSIVADVKTSGVCCIPAELLTRSVKQSQGTEVRAMIGGKQASISVGRAKFKLNILPSEAFPNAGMICEEGTHSFPLLKGLTERVTKEIAPAACTDPTRHYLCGVFVNATDSGLDFVSTDGRMLAKLTIESPEGVGEFPGVIVPTRVFGIAVGAERAVISDHFIRFESGDFIVASKLVDGSFPPYRRILLGFDTADKSVVVCRQELAKALSLIAQFGEGGKSVAVALRVSCGEMIIEGVSDRGEAMDAIAVDGDASFEIGVSCRVIGPLIDGFAGDTVRLSVADAKTPIVITDPADESRYALAWPYALRQPLAIAAWPASTQPITSRQWEREKITMLAPTASRAMSSP